MEPLEGFEQGNGKICILKESFKLNVESRL